MKILVFSDSHRELSNMRNAILEEHPDYVFHLGDHDRDAEDIGREFPTLPIVTVPGNCDSWDASTQMTRLVPIGGLRIFLCHGHTLGVKRGLLRARFAAMEQNADILFFGHTHEAYYEKEPSGLILFNPGACGSIAMTPSYGCLTITAEKTFQLIHKECYVRW